MGRRGEHKAGAASALDGAHACVLLLRQAGGVTLAGGSGAQQQAHQRAQIKWHELGADRRG
jgi:hypothetical protein